MEEKAKELILQFGRSNALLIANMIYDEHYNYKDPYCRWVGSFDEEYSNKELCEYWNNVRAYIERQTDVNIDYTNMEGK